MTVQEAQSVRHSRVENKFKSMSAEEWRSYLARLEGIPVDERGERLQISLGWARQNELDTLESQKEDERAVRAREAAKKARDDEEWDYLHPWADDEWCNL